MREGQRRLDVLLHEEDRHATPIDLAQDVEDGLDEARREAERRLVEDQERRARHERAPDRHHLLLAAREGAGDLPPAFSQNGEDRVDVLEPRRPSGPRARREGAELEVLLDGHRAEEPPPLGHHGDATLHDRVSRHAVERRALPADRAGARAEEPGDAPDERGLPRPIGAEERDDLPRAGGQRDTGEGEEGPVGGLHRPNLKHAARSPPHRPDRPRSPWGRRRWRRAGPRRSSRRRSAR